MKLMLENSVSREQLPMIEDVHQLISEVIDETRSLVCDLYPHVLRVRACRCARLAGSTYRDSIWLYCIATLLRFPKD
jgi:hypothetical protein